MLDAFIISDLLRKQRQEREDRQRPRLQIPVGPPPGWSPPATEADDEGERGVLIIDLTDDDTDTIRL